MKHDLSDILKRVINMKTDQEMLSSILKTTQMGQVGIRSVMGTAKSPKFRRALESQLKEYDSIEDEAHAIAGTMDWELPELRPGQKMMADMMTRMMLHFGGSDSKIAGMMIQGNTRGMIKGLKNRHQYPRRDSRVDILSQKLLDTETSNIRQMQPFL